MARNFTLFLIVAFIAFAIDQGSKFYVVEMLDLRNRLRLDVIPPYLNFRMGWNDGINFGLFSGSSDIWRWALVVIAIGASLWAAFWVLMQNIKIASWSAGLLAGGALANGYDRAVHGAVADFLNMSCCGISNPFAFNLADVFIFAGLFGLIYVMEFKKA